MKRYLLALLATCPLAAFAADVLPSHLVGTWGADPSMDLGTPGTQIMVLRADAYGMILASRPSESGEPGTVDVLGFPVRVTLEGKTVTLDPVHPSKDPGILAKQIVACRHDTASATRVGKDVDGHRQAAQGGRSAPVRRAAVRTSSPASPARCDAQD